jgi:hypothetical protein
VNGTASTRLVIVCDATAMFDVAEEYGVDLSVIADTTLLHEYGHAFADTSGADLDEEEEERVVEEFAQLAHQRRIAPKQADRWLRKALGT